MNITCYAILTMYHLQLPRFCNWKVCPSITQSMLKKRIPLIDLRCLTDGLIVVSNSLDPSVITEKAKRKACLNKYTLKQTLK